MMRSLLTASLLLTGLLVAACGGGGQPAGGGTSRPEAPAASSPAPAPAARGALADVTPAPAVQFGEPVTVRLWHTQTGVNEKALLALVDRFNQTNGKNITVKAEYQGNYTDLFKKTMAAIQAKDPPEMAAAYESFVAEYLTADAVVNLDEYLVGPQGYSQASLDDIFQPYLDTNRYPQAGNKLLSFPFTKSVLVLYYDEDMLKAAGIDKVPETWDEFADAVKKTTKKEGGQTTVYGWSVPVSASTFNGWVLSRGAPLMSPDNTKVAWNGEAGLASLRLLDELFKGGYAYRPQGYDYQNDFAQQKTAFVMESSTGRPFFRELINDGFKWGIAMIPQANPAQKATVQYGANIAVFKTTPLKQAAAWEFIKWFTERDQNAEWAIASSYMPIRKSVAQSPAMQQHWETKDLQGKQAFDLIQYSKPEPNVAGQQDIRNYIEDAITAVMTAKASPQAALDQAATKADRTLDEKR